MAKISVDQDTCIGCGMCVSVCPDVFELSSLTGKSSVKNGQENSALHCAQEAKNTCPTQAIKIS